MALTYPEDRTGVAVSNKVVNELQTITAQNNRNFHIVIPRFAPFYEDGFKVFKNINGNQLPLVKDVDYYFGYKYEGASLSTSKNIFGCVSFTDLTLNGEISIEYQCVGGTWTLDDQKILEIIANEVYNPRGRTWDQVHGKPTNFGPTSHIMDPADFFSEKEVGDKLDLLAEAIAKLATRPANTVPVTLSDLGIPKIGNWGLATVQQAIAGSSADTLITPLTLKAVLDNLGFTDTSVLLDKIKKHLEDKNNPHETKKESVDLSKVENRAMAADENILGNQDDEGYVSLTQIRRLLRIHGCQTRPEDEKEFLPKDAFISARCTSNFDRIGIFADGHGHQYEKIIEKNSVDCGYKPPITNNYPPHGTVLQYYCLDFDRWRIVADGYGGSYHSFVMANSLDCGFAGGGSVTKPPEGTLLSAYCDGTIMVQTLANGQGGSYEKRIPGHAECSSNVRPPDRGILVSTRCENKNEIGKYTDGAGSFYEQVIVQNSSKCGYESVTTKAPVSFPPNGTPQGSTCQGSTYVNLFANGSGGTYSEVVEYNSSRCGGGQTTTTTTTTRAAAQGTATYRSTLSYLTPTTSVKEKHTFTVENAYPNSTVPFKAYIKGSNGQETLTYSSTIITNASGYGQESVEVGVFGKDPNAAFVPDDTYQCWMVATINGTQVKSPPIVRTFAGFGSSPYSNMNIQFSVSPTLIQVGSSVYYYITLTGAQPNRSYRFSTFVVPTTPGYNSYKTYDNSFTTDGSGKATFTITPTLQNTPNGITGPSPIIPDADYRSWVEVEGVKSNDIYYTFRTGSSLQLRNSIFG